MVDIHKLVQLSLIWANLKYRFKEKNLSEIDGQKHLRMVSLGFYDLIGWLRFVWFMEIFRCEVQNQVVIGEVEILVNRIKV